MSRRDISLPALRVARSNAKETRVDFVACDLGRRFADEIVRLWFRIRRMCLCAIARICKRKSAITNRRWRCLAARMGSTVYGRLIPEAARLLKPGGWLMMEFGDARSRARDCWMDWDDVEIANDLAGIPRVIIARKPRDN